MTSFSITNILGKEEWLQTRAAFMLSTGRTGTDFLSKLYGYSTDVLALHEPPPELLKERQAAFQEVDRQPEKFRKIFKAQRKKLVTQALKEEKFYLETSARLTFFSPVIHELMPNAKFIYIHRHPADVIRSGMRRNWYNGHPCDDSRITPRPDEEAHQKWNEWTQFQKICWYWAAYNRFSLRFKESAAPGRLLEVPATEFFGDPVGVVKRLSEFLGVETPGDDLIKETSAQKVNAQTRGEFPKLSEWSEEMIAQCEEIAGPVAAELGYSLRDRG